MRTWLLFTIIIFPTALKAETPLERFALEKFFSYLKANKTLVSRIEGQLCPSGIPQTSARIDPGAFHEAREFLKGIDGASFAFTLDVADLLKYLPPWVDTSAGLEAAVFIKDGKLKVGVYFVPGAGAGIKHKTSTDVRVGLTSHCQDPVGYSEYFLNLTAASFTYSLGLDRNAAAMCAYEWLYPRGEEEKPQSFTQIQHSLQNAEVATKASLKDFDKRGGYQNPNKAQIQLLADEYINLWKSKASPARLKALNQRIRNLERHWWDMSVSAYDAEGAPEKRKASDVLENLSVRLRAYGTSRLGNFSSYFQGLLKRMEVARASKDTRGLVTLQAEIDVLFDKLANMKSELADVLFPLTQYDKASWNKLTDDTPDQVYEDAWRNIPPGGFRSAEQRLNALRDQVETTCTSPAGARFVETYLDHRYLGGEKDAFTKEYAYLMDDAPIMHYDCFYKKWLTPEGLRAAEVEMKSAEQLVAAGESLRKALGGYAHVLSNTRAQLLQNTKVNPYAQKIGGVENQCKNPISSCRSLTLPLQAVSSLSQASFYAAMGNVSSLKTLAKKAGSAIQATLRNPSFGASLSYYYLLSEFELPLSKINMPEVATLGDRLRGFCKEDVGLAPAEIAQKTHF